MREKRKVSDLLRLGESLPISVDIINFWTQEDSLASGDCLSLINPKELAKQQEPIKALESLNRACDNFDPVSPQSRFLAENLASLLTGSVELATTNFRRSRLPERTWVNSYIAICLCFKPEIKD